MHLKIKSEYPANKEINGTCNNKKFVKKSFDENLTEFCRCEPLWGFELLSSSSNKKLLKSSPKKKKKFVCKIENIVNTNPLQVPNYSILLVGHVSKSSPTQIPIKIKRYERN